MTSIPEIRFLTRCLPRPHDASRDHGSNNDGLDWSRLVDLAQWHGVFPLLARKVLSESGQHAESSFPHSLIADLKVGQGSYLHRGLVQISALIELQREFDRSSITVVCWKGPSLGLLLYGSATLRESGDLDFLFLEKDLPAVQQIAARLGYEAPELLTAKDRYEFSLQHEFSFFRSRDQVLLEFHSQILTSHYAAWQDSETYITRADLHYPLAGYELLLQCPEDLLLSLCVHAAKHRWERLKWSCDIALFLERYRTDLDWTRYLATLAETGKHSIVLIGLALVGDLFEVPLPPAVVNALKRTPTVTALATALGDHLKTGSKESVPPGHASALVDLLCPRLSDRIVYVLSPIVRLEYEDLSFPSRTSPLFLLNYPYRFWRLLRRYGLPRLLSMTTEYLRSVR